MIHVERGRADNAGVPIRPGEQWFTAAKTKTGVALTEKTAHEADRTVYHGDDVHAALERLFDHKCAYCETRATASGTWDVEHFRPKGRVAENDQHPGYYWLTYEWTNLYLSCQNCNQRRRDRPTWENPVARPAAGKLDQFPLADEATRVMDPHGDLAAEARLLLDPCDDDPEYHVTFTLLGDVVARDDSVMGERSIYVYHLGRRPLVDARRAHIEVILKVIDMQRKWQPLPDAIAAVTAIYDQADVSYIGVTRAIRRDPAAFGLTSP